MYENGQLLYTIGHRSLGLSSLPPLQGEEAVLLTINKHFIFHFNFIPLMNNNPIAIKSSHNLFSKHFKFLNYSKLPPGGFRGLLYSARKTFAGRAHAAFAEWNMAVPAAVSTIKKADIINGTIDNPVL